MTEGMDGKLPAGPPPPPPSAPQSAPLPTAPSLRQAAARVQRAIRQGRPRAHVAEELLAAGMDQAQVQDAINEGDKAERRSINNLMLASVITGFIGLVMIVLSVIIGLDEAPALFGWGFGAIIGLALPPFINGVVRLVRMS